MPLGEDFTSLRIYCYGYIPHRRAILQRYGPYESIRGTKFKRGIDITDYQKEWSGIDIIHIKVQAQCINPWSKWATIY
jgi:hypothetical protein